MRVFDSESNSNSNTDAERRDKYNMLTTKRFLENFKLFLVNLFYFIRNNFLLLLLTGFFFYRTFFVGNLNYALLILLISLFLMIVCQILYKFAAYNNVRLLYRFLVLCIGILLVTSLYIQATRFVDVFVPTLTEPTPAKILVRLGIVTVTLYVFGLFFSFFYYLYVNDMLSSIWNASITRKFEPSPLIKDKGNWRRERYASIILVNILIWGGVASVATLSVGFIAWLLR